MPQEIVRNPLIITIRLNSRMCKILMKNNVCLTLPSVEKNSSLYCPMQMDPSKQNSLVNWEVKIVDIISQTLFIEDKKFLRLRR